MLTLATVALAAVTLPPERIVFIDPGIGYVAASNGGYFGTTTMAYAAFGGFGVGGHIDTATKFGPAKYAIGASVGGHVIGGEWIRFALFGEAGLHVYTGVGSSLLTTGGGTTTMSYGGVRATLASHLGKSGRVAVGATVVYRNDLGRKDVSYTTRSGLFCTTNCTQTETARVGEGTLGLMVIVGVSF